MSTTEQNRTEQSNTLNDFPKACSSQTRKEEKRRQQKGEFREDKRIKGRRFERRERRK